MTPQVLPTPQTVGTYSQSLPVNQYNDGTVAKVPWYKTRTCKVIMVGLGILAAAGAVAAFLASSFVAAGVLGAAGLVCLGIPLYQTLFAPKPMTQRTVSPAPQKPVYTAPQPLAQPQPAQPAYYPVPTATPVQPSVRTLTNYNGHTLKHYDLTKGGDHQLLQNIQPCRALHNPVIPIIQQHPDGAAGVARAYLQNHPQALIAMGIAGNSGKPGGGLQDAQYQFNSSQVNPKAKGQEEGLFSEWLINECGIGNPAQQILFSNTVQGQWGFTYGQIGRVTKQGRDYTQTTNPADYKDAWPLSNIPIFPNPNNPTIGNPNSPKVGYVIVAGPNTCANANDTTGQGSMANTLNALALSNYTFFKECVKQTLVALFVSAKAEGYDVMLVPQISCGIYAGPWRNAMTGLGKGGFSQGDFMREILPSVLNEKVGNNGLTIGHLFNEVIIPTLPPKIPKAPRGRRAGRAGGRH